MRVGVVPMRKEPMTVCDSSRLGLELLVELCELVLVVLCRPLIVIGLTFRASGC